MEQRSDLYTLPDDHVDSAITTRSFDRSAHPLSSG
jgi:hypothetical protein